MPEEAQFMRVIFLRGDLGRHGHLLHYRYHQRLWIWMGTEMLKALGVIWYIFSTCLAVDGRMDGSAKVPLPAQICPH